MIDDELGLVLAQSKVEPPSARISASRAAARKLLEEPREIQHLPPPSCAMHSVEELAMVGMIDVMPVMQVARRKRAPATMSARPRISKAKPPEAPRPRGSRKPRTPKDGVPGKARKPQADAPLPPPSALTHRTLIDNLQTVDLAVKERALQIADLEITSEPVLPIHTAVRVVLQASLELHRPYDTNMLAATFVISRSLVMQSLRKYYHNFIDQSILTEANFVPTYLWLYDLDDDESIARVNHAISITDSDKPGCRSVFAVARDFVLLYVTEIASGVAASHDLTALAAATALLSKTVPCESSPPKFLEITNSFLYRARITGRQIMKDKTGTLASLFAVEGPSQ